MVPGGEVIGVWAKPGNGDDWGSGEGRGEAGLLRPEDPSEWLEVHTGASLVRGLPK